MTPPETIKEPEAPISQSNARPEGRLQDQAGRSTRRQLRRPQKKADAIAAATAVGQTVTLTGTYDSFTASPVQIIMKDGVVVLPKATKPAAAPVHHTAAHPAHR